MAQLIRSPSGMMGGVDHESRSFTEGSAPDTEFSDLVHSWRRLDDPGLRRMAIRFIRMLGEDIVREQQVRREVT
jgi:hypothetical protein